MGESYRGRRIQAWLAVGLWTALILILAGEQFSADETRGWLRALLLRIVPGLEHRTLVALHAAVRKGAHVLEYAVLALLTFRALRIGAPHGPARSAGLALAFVLAVAGIDETRQARSAQRTGSLRDVALDLAGGGSALGALALARRVVRRPEAPRDA